jgi:FkbM family methyltransferase
MKYQIILIIFKLIFSINFLIIKITKKDFLLKLKEFYESKCYTAIKILNKNLVFFTPNHLTKWLVNTMLTKEPETINWINSFKKKKIIFWDIGANLGLYSIYAAIKHKNIFIYSFEPSVNNLRILSRNIFINNLEKKIIINQIPLTNKKNKYLTMSQRSFIEGDALNTFGEKFNFEGKKMKSTHNYQIYGTTIDSLVNTKSTQLPNYIKIDVDGIEHLILSGGKKLLKNKNILSIIIEINDKFKKQHKSIFKILKNCNFKLYKKEQNYNLLKSTEYTNTFNYTFVKISKKIFIKNIIKK